MDLPHNREALQAAALQHFGVPIFVLEILEYCNRRENGEVFHGWDAEVIKQVITYHLLKKTLLVHRDKDGKIDGVFMWYRCNSDDGWEFVRGWEPDRPDGDTLFMAFLFSDGKEVLKDMTAIWCNQHPEWKECQITGLRLRGGRPTPVKYPHSLFQKILTL